MKLHQEVGAVRREVVLDAPREDVWAHLAHPDGLEGWLADEVELDAVEPGAEGRVREDGEERLVTVEEVEPARRVSLTWCAPGGAPSLVELTLSDDDDPQRTRLVVIELPLVALRAARREITTLTQATGPSMLVAA